MYTAIQNLHKKGIVHLDINPNNIWVPEDPKKPVILLDLGSMHEIGETRTVITGTPGYFPVFGNLRVADPELNLYAYKKILEKYPPMADAASGAAGGAAGGAGGGGAAGGAAGGAGGGGAAGGAAIAANKHKGGKHRRITNRKKRSQKRRV
jgi:hypothetical protein